MNPQNKITNIVELYKINFASEYADFCKGMSDKREFQMNEFSSTGGDGAVHQLVREVPITLDNMMKVRLDKEELAYYNSKLGAEWFGRTFKEFSPAIKV